MLIRTLLVFSICLLTACDHSAPVSKAAPIPVKVESIMPHSDDSGIRYSATVTPMTQVNLAFKVDGYIGSIRQVRAADGQMRDIDKGMAVSRDMVLAQVKDDEYRDTLNEAKGNLGVAEAAWVKAQQDYRRARILYQEQSMTAPDYDSAQQEYSSARDNVTTARAQLHTAQQNLAYCTLKSPIDGVLLSRNIETGELVAPGTTAFVVADLSSVKVLFAVPDLMLKNITLGDSMGIKTRSLPGRVFNGKVTNIAPSADKQTRVFEIELTIPNPDGLLKNNMVAALQVPKLEQVKSSLIQVPIDAVVHSHKDPTGYALYLAVKEADGSFARLTEVRLGKVHGNRIDVLSGLEKGSQVIVSGVNTVWDGSPVKVME